MLFQMVPLLDVFIVSFFHLAFCCGKEIMDYPFREGCIANNLNMLIRAKRKSGHLTSWTESESNPFLYSKSSFGTVRNPSSPLSNIHLPHPQLQGNTSKNHLIHLTEC